MAAVSRFINSVYDTYPDNDTSKEVSIQAAGREYSGIGDRHVLMWWDNFTSREYNVTQIVQLTGQPGNYTYYAPVAKKRTLESRLTNLQISLGKFTRAQRDQILQLAKNVKFQKSSTTNGCRVWTRDLLEAMVGTGLISQSLFDEIDAKIPLVKRKAEA